MIPEVKYVQIIEVLPILCVDIVVRNWRGEYLLIKRANEPLKGHWWVIGGRVFKGETLEQAAVRKVREETGVSVSKVRPIGYYEDAFEANPFGLSTPMHSVSVVFSAVLNPDCVIKLDEQSSNWMYSRELPQRFKIREFAFLAGKMACL